MKCFCKNKVQWAFLLGIVLSLISIMECFFGLWFDYSQPLVTANFFVPILFQNTTFITGSIIKGIMSLIIHTILVYGTLLRSTTALSPWIILSSVNCLCIFLLCIHLTLMLLKCYYLILTIIILIYFGIIFLTICTIYIARRAREEIEKKKRLLFKLNQISQNMQGIDKHRIIQLQKVIML